MTRLCMQQNSEDRMFLLGEDVANQHGRLLQTYGKAVLYLAYLAAAVLYTVGPKFKVCYHLFFQWIHWVNLGHTLTAVTTVDPSQESLATHRESLQSRQWRSFQCGGRVWGVPPVFSDVLKTPCDCWENSTIFRVFLWVNICINMPCCHIWMIINIHKYRILEIWHEYFPGNNLCMGLLPAFLQTSCDTVCKLPYSTFCNVTYVVLQYDIIHNLQNCMFYKASYPRGVKDIRIVLGPGFEKILAMVDLPRIQ